jgi:predicted ATPase
MAKDIAPNVVEIILESMQKLSEKSRSILSLVSCVGNEISVSSLLKYCCGMNFTQLVPLLWPAIQVSDSFIDDGCIN